MEKALLAKSVRDFEKAISMVSYGFKEIEDFYSKSSTQGVVGNVKIPVLFIQVHIFVLVILHCFEFFCLFFLVIRMVSNCNSVKISE